MALLEELSLKQLQQFHSIDRMAYSRLVLTLGFDPSPSMKIVAFWNFLERIGFKHFVNNLKRLSDSSLSTLAEETVLCLECLYCPSEQIFQWVDLDFPEMKKLVAQEILLFFLFNDRVTVIRMIEDFVKQVCEVAFADIVRENLGSKQPDSPTSEGGDHSGEIPISKSNVTDDEGEVDSENRTLFITFSRGHPVSNQELTGFFVEKFGTCLEAIYMDKSPKRLFACVVLKSHSDVCWILGGKKLVKLFINDKQVRVRRFVPKSMKH